MTGRPLIPGLKSVRQGGNVLVTAVLTLGILGMVNYLGIRRHTRFDLTAENRFTLSAQTRQILARLSAPVELTAFYPSDDQTQVQLRRVLEQYAAASSQVRFEFVDPDQAPGMAARYGVHEPGLIVSAGARREKARTPTEEGITNALLRVMESHVVRIGYVTTHGERNPMGRDRDGCLAAISALNNTLYRATRAEIPAAGVPDSIDVLMLVGPKAEPLPGEIDSLDRFLKRGGRLLVMLDPPPGAGLAELLGRWGAVVGGETVVDLSSPGRLAGLDEFTPVVSRYEDSPITRDFNIRTYFRLCRPVELVKALPEGARGWVLFRSGNNSWAETTPTARPLKLDPGIDRLGPIGMAVAIQYAEGKGARLVVFGDSDFASNRDWRLPGTGDLFLNAVAWLAERGDEISVRPASTTERRIDLTAGEARNVFWLGVISVPGLILLAGVAMGWHRRQL